MKRVALGLVCAVFCLSCSSPGKGGTGPSSTSPKTDHKLKQLLAEGDPPALGVRKIVNDKVAYEFFGGRRSIQFEELVTPNDKWYLGAIVKPMTSYLIGDLIDQRKLSLETRLAEALPGFAPAGSPNENIRIRDLLSHRSGLVEPHELRDPQIWSDALNSMMPTGKQREKLVKAILQEPPKFQPGSKYEYSNSGYLVLGAIIEAITKRSWEREMAARLFHPLGMNGCGFASATSRMVSPPEQPWGHGQTEGRLMSVQPFAIVDESSPTPTALGPSNVVLCDFDSWGIFLEEMINASKGYSKILKAQTAQALFREYKSGVALGGWGAKSRFWSKGVKYTMSGSNDLNYAVFVINPEDNSIIMAAANSGTPNARKALSTALKSLGD